MKTHGKTGQTPLCDDTPIPKENLCVASSVGVVVFWDRARCGRGMCGRHLRGCWSQTECLAFNHVLPMKEEEIMINKDVPIASALLPPPSRGFVKQCLRLFGLVAPDTEEWRPASSTKIIE